jgi:glycosyltransferase involved in cell wall biosynthesis
MFSFNCAIVSRDTAQLHETIKQNETGRLVDFFDAKALIQEVSYLLGNSAERTGLGTNARQFAQTHYDLQTVCLPKQLACSTRCGWN